MAYNNADIDLIATLDESSSEAEILKAIKILNGRLKGNGNAKIKLDSELDVKSVQKVIKKLETLLNSKNLSVNTKDSILSIQKEANAMLEVVSSANKASKEKLEFANANKRVADSADNTSRAIRNERNAMQSLDDINYILQNINMQGQAGNGVFQQFGNTLRDAFYAFTAANLLQDAIYKVIDGGKEAVETVKELNDAAVSLRMATGDSYNSVKQLMSDYNAMAQELGVVTTSVSEAADEWLRQGHSIEDTNTLITDSMMLSKISNLESADSTKYLTSAMQGYKVAVNDVVGIVDKLSAVDLESATDAGGLAEAMSKTAEGAQIAGISMDRLLGMIATVGEVTQKSMSSIGESYKTVFSRMRDIKDNKLSVIGEDGEIEDLSNVEIVLDSLGIKLRDSNLEFRNFQDVLDDVAGSWDSYSSVQKAAIAKAFSGVRQQENFLVMMENWDKVVEYTNIAANSAGTASEKFEYHLESLEAKTNSLKASLENLASTTISDELYGSVLDTTKAVVDMTAESGILKGALAGLGTAGAIYVFQQLTGYLRNATQELSSFGKALSMIRNGQVGIDEMQNLINLTGGLTQSQTRLLLSTNNLTDSQKAAIIMNQRLAQGLPQITEAEALQQLQTMGVATAQGTATGTTISLTSAMRGLWSTLMANPIVLVTTAVTAGVMAWNHYKQAQEEARQTAIELTNTYKQEKESLDSQIESYKELKQKLDNGNLSTDEARSIKEQLLEIQQSLVDSYGDEASNIDLVNGKYKEQLGLLSELSKEKASEYVKENRSAFETAKKELEKTRSYEVGSIFSYESSKGMSDEQKQLYEYIKSYSDLFEIKRLYDTSTLSNSDYAPTLFVNANADDAKEIIDKFYDDIEKYIKDNNLQLDYDSLQIDLSKVSSDIETDDTLKEYRTIYDEFMKAEIVRNDTLRPLYKESIKAVEDYNNALSTGEGVEEAKANLDSVQQSVQNATGELEGSQDVFDGIYDGINKDAEAAYNLGQAFENDKTVQEYAEQLRGLSDIDLKAINFDNDNAEKGEEAFRGLMETLGLTEEQAQSLIDKLVELGYVQGEVQSSTSEHESNISSFSDAWNSEDFENARKELLSLAEAGRLTPETLQSTEEYKKLLEQTGMSAEEAAKKINSMTDASTQLQSMSEQISKMSDMLADKKNGTTASASDLAGFDATVKGLESWTEFERVMGSSKSSMEECQAAANALATEWVNNGNFLANLTEENKDYYITQLDNMGVMNAEALVTDRLSTAQLVAQNTEKALSAATTDLSDKQASYTQRSVDAVNATYENSTALATQEGMTNAARIELADLVAEQTIFSNQDLGVTDKIAALGELAGAYMGAAAQASFLNKTQGGLNSNYRISPEEAWAQVKDEFSRLDTTIVTPIIKPTGSGNYKPSGGSGGSKTKETKQTIDWIERKITILNNKIDAFATKASDAWSSWTSRTKALNSEMETTQKLLTSVYGVSDKLQKKYNKQKSTAKIKLDNYVKDNSKVLTSSTIKKINNGTLDTSKLSKKDKKVVEQYKKLQKDYEKKAKKASQNPAADYYFSKANSVAKKYKLSPAIIKKIKNGTINISDYNESMANAIQKYQDYYDKGKDAQKSKKEAKQKLNELAQQNFELIQSKWDSRIGYQENRKNAVSDALNLAEAKGQLIGSAYYTKQKGINDKEISQYKKEEAELKKAMKDVPKYSEEWYNMKSKISEVHSKYVQLQADNAELQRSINELKFDRFDELINKFNDISDEANFLIDMLDSDNLFNSDNGSITNDGITAMGLTAQNYDVYLAQAEEYKNSIADLEQMYKNGEIGISDYNSRMRELQEGYRNSIKSANEAKKAVISYVKDGLDAQNQALEKSVSKQKELLQSEKDLYDFQRKISDQNKNIANLRKQIAALEGDSSIENRKRLQQLKSDLQDAEQEQKDTLYDRSIEDSISALDKMVTDAEDVATQYLKNSEKVFVDALGYVNKNTSQVSQNLEKISKDLGYDISTYITNAWKDGGDAVGTYESTLSSNVPKIIAQIQLITNAWNAQCEAAEKAAKASAKAAAGTDETTKDTDKKGNSSNGSGNKSKTSSAKDIKKYITDHADKATQKKSYYGVLNQYIYDKTGGKVLSVKEEVELAKMLGVSVKSDLSGSDDRKKIYNALLKKKIAFANGGILGDLVKLTGEDGVFIGSAGESILTKEQTQALIDFRPAIPQLNTMVDLMKNIPISSAPQSPTYNIEVSNNVSGAVSQETLNEMRKIATNQAETVIKKINSATYAKGVRR